MRLVSLLVSYFQKLKFGLKRRKKWELNKIMILWLHWTKKREHEINNKGSSLLALSGISRGSATGSREVATRCLAIVRLRRIGRSSLLLITSNVLLFIAELLFKGSSIGSDLCCLFRSIEARLDEIFTFRLGDKRLKLRSSESVNMTSF